MSKVFISYRHVSPDEQCAVQLAAILERHGFEIFFDRRINVGRRWVEEIERHLRSAQHFVVLLSADSVRSDMLRQEVADAHILAGAGKMRIYPVRLDFTGALPHDLGAYLNPLQYVVWTPTEPWEATCQDLLDSLEASGSGPSAVGTADAPSDGIAARASMQQDAGAPFPAADPRLDTGAIELDSPFYVERSDDSEVKRLAALPGKTVLIKGPRQVGKTSLLTRAKGAAEQAGHRVVYIDFQLIDSQHLESIEGLATYLAHRIARTFDTAVKPSDVWDDHLGAPDSLTDFIDRAVLTAPAPITLCFDEVDRMFDYSYRNAFFAMVRAWHNRRASYKRWSTLGLLLAHSTEPALFIDDVNQTPFNVGEIFRLQDFEMMHIAWLNQRHGTVLSPPSSLDTLYLLLGGHPYLLRQAFFGLATKRIGSLADLVATAANDDGPFGDHLRRHLFGLSRTSRMAGAFRQILHEQRCHDEGDFQRLKGAGLVEGTSRESARVRCDLYRRYFSRHL